MIRAKMYPHTMKGEAYGHWLSLTPLSDTGLGSNGTVTIGMIRDQLGISALVVYLKSTKPQDNEAVEWIYPAKYYKYSKEGYRFYLNKTILNRLPSLPSEIVPGVVAGEYVTIPLDGTNDK